MSNFECIELLLLCCLGCVIAFAGAYLGWWWLMAGGFLLVPVYYLPRRRSASADDEGCGWQVPR